MRTTKLLAGYFAYDLFYLNVRILIPTVYCLFRSLRIPPLRSLIILVLLPPSPSLISSIIVNFHYCPLFFLISNFFFRFFLSAFARTLIDPDFGRLHD